jgi:hypothetical protein
MASLLTSIQLWSQWWHSSSSCIIVHSCSFSVFLLAFFPSKSNSASKNLRQAWLVDSVAGRNGSYFWAQLASGSAGTDGKTRWQQKQKRPLKCFGCQNFTYLEQPAKKWGSTRIYQIPAMPHDGLHYLQPKTTSQTWWIYKGPTYDTYGYLWTPKKFERFSKMFSTSSMTCLPSFHV